MLKDSVFNRLFIKISIFSLRAIAPICTLYCCARLLKWRPKFPIVLVQTLDTYAVCESLFYLALYLPRKRRLNRAVPYYNPLPSRAQRRGFFTKTWDATYDTHRHLSGWFYGAPLEKLRREDVKDFILWGLWNRTERYSKDEEELEEYLSYTEDVLDWRFPPGRSGLQSMMVTFEPVRMTHRPLLWYTIFIGGTDLQFWIFMILYGFTHYRLPRRHFFSNFPFRFLSLFTKQQSPSSHISYWYRPNISNSHIPVLFIHGIGIGLHTYLPFFAQYLHTMPETGIIAIEIPAINSRISHPMLHGPAMAHEILQILKSHNWTRVILATHSYGSVVAAHLLHDPKLSPLIDHLLFVDPVAFSFHTPDVAFNFLRRKPKTASEIQLQYFASMDPDVARALTRSFVVAENLLWRGEVENRVSGDGKRRLKTTVAICGRDIITDTVHLGRCMSRREREGGKWYREKEVADDADDWMQAVWTGEKNLEVIWFPELNHAECFNDHGHRKVLVDVLETYSRDISRDIDRL